MTKSSALVAVVPVTATKVTGALRRCASLEDYLVGKSVSLSNQCPDACKFRASRFWRFNRRGRWHWIPLDEGKHTGGRRLTGKEKAKFRHPAERRPSRDDGW